MKEPLARKPHDFEKLRSPTKAASDWRGADSVDYLSLEIACEQALLFGRAVRERRPLAASPLARAFSRGSLRLPK